MIQYALVGCGRIAHKHLPEIQRTGMLTALCDTDEQKAHQLAAGTTARVYTRIDDLLEQEPAVTVVVVCSPNGQHAEHAIKSLQAGRHVLVEKPMCLSSAAAWSMRDTAHFFRRQLFVVQQNRFAPPVQTVKRLLEQNALGRILSFSVTGIWHRPQAYYTGGWQGHPEQDGGILFTQFSHFIDLLLWFLGDIRVVAAQQQQNGLRQHFEMADTCTALLQTNSGALGTAHFSINAHGSNKEGAITLVGELGTVKIGGPYLNTLDWLDTRSAIAPAPVAGQAPGASYHGVVYHQLVQALTGQPHQLPAIAESLRTVAFIEQLHKYAQHP